MSQNHWTTSTFKQKILMRLKEKQWETFKKYIKMITKYLLPLLFATSLVAEESTLDKFGALVIRIHQGTENLFVNIPAAHLGRNRRTKRIP